MQLKVEFHLRVLCEEICHNGSGGAMREDARCCSEGSYGSFGGSVNEAMKCSEGQGVRKDGGGGDGGIIGGLA